jgi:hypothetical protein
MQGFGQGMMAGHGVVLSAFFVQPDCPSGAFWPEVVDVHLQGSVDAREAVGEG